MEWKPWPRSFKWSRLTGKPSLCELRAQKDKILVSRPVMFYRRYTPRPPLAAFVDCIWYSEGFEGTHERERLLPNGESGIVFDLRADPVRIYDAQDPGKFETHAPAIFCGARIDCFIIDTCQQERVLGIQFRPGGAFPFLGMPACEAANATYSLEEIWPGHGQLIHEELMSAPDVDAMFGILERVLTSRLAVTLHPAVSFAVASLGRPAGPAGSLRVRDVVDRVGLSSRRFIELFRNQTGLTPKSFQRVRRFQKVLQTLRAHPHSEENWAALAAGSGYYDQAHFIHDFKIFSGMTPGEYLTLATPHLNHVPLK
jgi:AraC-like DNA-binding protein